MGVIYDQHYVCRPKRQTLFAKAPFSRETQRELGRSSLVFRSTQGAPPGLEFEARAKIVFVLRMKQLFASDSFLRSCPASIEFFDTWFELEPLAPDFTLSDVTDNLTADLFGEGPADAAATELAATWLDRGSARNPRHHYRVVLDDPTLMPEGNDRVIGWIADLSWHPSELRGRWTPTTNATGKAFAATGARATGARVRVEVSGDFVGSMSVDAAGDVVVRANDAPPDPKPA